MNYKPLSEVVKNIMTAPEKEGLDTPIRGSGRLESGWHNVTILSVETERLADQGRITVLLDRQGAYHRESVWLMSRDGSELGWKFKLLVKGVFGDHVYEYIKLLNTEQQEEMLHVLRGMKLAIQIKPSNGYTVHMDGDDYVPVDVRTTLAISKPQPTIAAARRAAEQSGYKRSYNNLSSTESINADGNFEALQNAQNAILRAAGTVSTS